MAGRPRKPAAVRIAEGNPGHREIPVEISFPGVPKCPTWLDAGAKKEWKRIVEALADVDLLRATDTAVLARYCVAYSRWVIAEKTISDEGTIIRIVGSTGQEKVMPHPALKVSDMAQGQLQKAGASLGFSPTDRTKVSAPPRDTGGNSFDDLD